MTILIYDISKLVGKLTISNLNDHSREEILRDIQILINEYFRGKENKIKKIA